MGARPFRPFTFAARAAAIQAFNTARYFATPRHSTKQPLACHSRALPQMLFVMQPTSDPGKDTDWLVLPHAPIQELAENLWRVEGDLPRFSMKRVMTVARLHTGELLIHSAIALDEASMKRLEAWGTPSILLIPHVRHRLDAPRFKHRYPALRVFAPK